MNWNFQEILTKDPSSAWGCDISGNIPPCGVTLMRTCRCTEFHRVKNSNLLHPSCTVVLQKLKSASPILHSCNAKTQICVTRPQCVTLLRFTLDIFPISSCCYTLTSFSFCSFSSVHHKLSITFFIFIIQARTVILSGFYSVKNSWWWWLGLKLLWIWWWILMQRLLT